MMKTCPFCAEEIQDAAIKCRYCGSDLEDTPRPAARASSLAEEIVYHADDDIRVTSSRAVIGGKTYAMANITSVSVAEDSAAAGCGCGLLGVGGLMALGLASADLMGMGVLGLMLLAFGAFLMSLKSYIVRIGSASGESDALKNSDREYIQGIVDAVNQAIVDRR